MDIDSNLKLTEQDLELLRKGDESPKGGVNNNEHCVAVLSRKARVVYIYKSKPKLR
jgi:hypothetical protein